MTDTPETNDQLEEEKNLEEAAAALVGTTEETKFGKIKYISIVKEMEKSYLDYAMSVIVSRALPDVRDGLKPVHRRILYAMHKAGISHSSSYKKSARIVGDVLGKYHPHGNDPVYGALVRLAQEFSMRYPLIDGQGNFGSIDGDSPAAMRYTEARLAKISQELLADIDKDTVKFTDNFDGSLQEPSVLPGRLPNLLLMGSEGIAVGMATKIPPHNLEEVCSAITAMIHAGKSIVNKNEDEGKPKELPEKTKSQIKSQIFKTEEIDQVLETDPAMLAGQFTSDITMDEIMDHIKGPDFPTAGIIYNRKDIKEAYQTGKGRIIIRSKAKIHETKKGRFQIIVNELPYQVNKSRLLIKIANLVRNKKIVGIKDLRDDSDRSGLQVTIDLKRDARPKVVLNKLFKYSELQTSFSLNMVALNSQGTPQLMNIGQVLREYIGHRQLVVVRRSQYQLRSARDRAHILEGLLIALANLDDVIETIRRSPDTDTAKNSLIKKFKLTDVQAQAILDMQLKRLAALERQKIEDEYKAIQETIGKLLKLLSNPRSILKVINKETQELITLYGNKRRTKVITGKVGEFSEEDLIASEPTVIMMTETGYIKRMNPKSLRSQSRGGKGSIGMKMKNEDMVKFLLAANTHDNLLLFTNMGRVFKIRAFELPESSRQAKGTAVVNIVNLKSGELVQSMLIVDQKKDQKKFITLATRKGLVKKTAVKLYENIRQNGIVAITLNKEDELVWGKLTSGQDHIMLVTNQGKSIRFSEKEVKASQRDTKGVKGITLKGDDFVLAVEAFNPEEPKEKDIFRHLLVITERGMGKRTALKEYPLQKRSGMGVKVADVTKRTGKVAKSLLVNQTHKEIVISTKEGQAIKLPLEKKSVPILTRPTQGVILMRLKKSDVVVAVTLIGEWSTKPAAALVGS